MMLTNNKRSTSSDFYIILFLVMQVSLNAIANYLQDNVINNHLLYHLNSVMSQCLFTSFFISITPKALIKKFFLACFVGYISFFLINVMFIQPYNTFNSYSYALGALLLVLFSFFSFQDWISSIPELPVLNLKEFWIIACILLYYGSSFFIFISYHYLSDVSPANVGILWKLHNGFLAVGSFLLLKALMSNRWIREFF